MDAKVDGGTFTGFNDFLLNLLADFCDHLLNTCRVNTSIRNKVVQGQTADFTAHRVESTDYNCFRGVIDHDFHACSGFKGTDVAALTSNDAALHIVIINMKDGDTIFNGRFRCNTLNGLDDDALGFLIGRQFRFIHNFIDVALGMRLSLGFQAFHQSFFRFTCRKP